MERSDIFNSERGRGRWKPIEASYVAVERQLNPLSQRILIPPRHLQGVVKYIWYFCPKQMQRMSKSFHIVPDGSPGIVFHHTGGKPTIADSRGGMLPLAFVHGQDLLPCINEDLGDSLVIGVKFFSSSFKQIFGIDAFEATNRLIPLNDLAGYNIADRMLHAKTPEELYRIIIDYLTLKYQSAKAEDEMVRDAVSTISENRHITPAGLSRKYHISQRQFQRRFKTHVGLNPETFIRVMKFQRSLYLIRSGQYKKLSDVAYELGYADQAHFIREFREFSGFTPKTVVQYLPPLHQGDHISCSKPLLCTFRILA